MQELLTAIGIVLLVILVLLVVILSQRINYELYFNKYDSWTLRLRIDYCWEQLAVEVRYDGGAGLFWEVVWPFGEMDSHRKSKAEKKARTQERIAAEAATDSSAAASDPADDTDATDGLRAERSWEEIKEQYHLPEEDSMPEREEKPIEDKEDEKKTDAGDYIRLLRYALDLGIVPTTGLYLQRLWDRTKPRYAEGAARIGLSDAYTQGLLMGGMYTCMPQVAARIHFTFTEEIMEGHFRFGGGVRPIGVLWDTIRWLAAPAVRKTAWYYWREVRQ